MIVNVPDLKVTLKKPQYWVQNGIRFVSIKKAFNKYEKEIWKIEKIRVYPFLASLVSYKEDADGKTALLVVAADDYTLDKLTEEIVAEIGMPMEWFASSLLVDILAAVQLLHEYGYVHGDIQPKNIIFNKTKGHWKLIGLGHAMPIEESLKTSRACSNKRYASQHVLETGTVRPLDDFIALALVLKRGFPKFFKKSMHYLNISTVTESILTENDVSELWWESAYKIHFTLCCYDKIPKDATLALYDAKYPFS